MKSYKTFTVVPSPTEYQLGHINNMHRAVSKFGSNIDEVKSNKNGYVPYKSLIKRIFKNSILSEDKHKKTNLLSVGCRSPHELDFINYVISDELGHKDVNITGVDLFNVYNDNRIIVDNAEMFSNTKESNKKFNIIFSDNNLEHLSDPVSHFSNLIDLLEDKSVLFYILPCWHDINAVPTTGHPNLINCTKMPELMNEKNVKEYLDEIFQNCNNGPIKYELVDYGAPEEDFDVLYFVITVEKL
jgi:hypothetical protein